MFFERKEKHSFHVNDCGLSLLLRLSFPSESDGPFSFLGEQLRSAQKGGISRDALFLLECAGRGEGERRPSQTNN